MGKQDVLSFLASVRDIGCCNMLDRTCVISVARQAGEDEIARYLEDFNPGEYWKFLMGDFSEYLKDKRT